MAASDAPTDAPATARMTVAIRDLSVSYRAYEDLPSARSFVSRSIRRRHRTTVDAVRSITTDFHAGEAVGLIGANGSGKSTLLRTIAGLQPKTSGHVYVSSQPQFLGVAAALKLKLSGYQNVYLGGLAIGLSRAEVDERMEEVIEFCGIGSAMSRPMQTYSAGMRARLAFSIATLRTPEILLLDEALAVGDRSFRDRSIAKINEIKENANTILLVTHNLPEIRRTCSRAIWMNEGQIAMDGGVDEVLSAYETFVDG